MAVLDPMGQYDPASAALMTQQVTPQQRVAQAMMGQQGGGMSQLTGPLNALILQRMMAGKPPQGLLRPPDPVIGTGYAPSPMDQAPSLSTMQPNWYSGYTQAGRGY